MAYYRLYLLQQNGHIGDVVDFVCDSDEEAIARAAPHRRDQAMELWNRGRRVQVFPAAANDGGGASRP